MKSYTFAKQGQNKAAGQQSKLTIKDSSLAYDSHVGLLKKSDSHLSIHQDRKLVGLNPINDGIKKLKELQKVKNISFINQNNQIAKKMYPSQKTKTKQNEKRQRKTRQMRPFNSQLRIGEKRLYSIFQNKSPNNQMKDQSRTNQFKMTSSSFVKHSEQQYDGRSSSQLKRATNPYKDTKFNKIRPGSSMANVLMTKSTYNISYHEPNVFKKVQSSKQLLSKQKPILSSFDTDCQQIQIQQSIKQESNLIQNQKLSKIHQLNKLQADKLLKNQDQSLQLLINGDKEYYSKNISSVYKDESVFMNKRSSSQSSVIKISNANQQNKVCVTQASEPSGSNQIQHTDDYQCIPQDFKLKITNPVINDENLVSKVDTILGSRNDSMANINDKSGSKQLSTIVIPNNPNQNSSFIRTQDLLSQEFMINQIQGKRNYKMTSLNPRKNARMALSKHNQQISLNSSRDKRVLQEQYQRIIPNEEKQSNTIENDPNKIDTSANNQPNDYECLNFDRKSVPEIKGQGVITPVETATLISHTRDPSNVTLMKIGYPYTLIDKIKKSNQLLSKENTGEININLLLKNQKDNEKPRQTVKTESDFKQFMNYLYSDVNFQDMNPSWQAVQNLTQFQKKNFAKIWGHDVMNKSIKHDNITNNFSIKRQRELSRASKMRLQFENQYKRVSSQLTATPQEAQFMRMNYQQFMNQTSPDLFLNQGQTLKRYKSTQLEVNNDIHQVDQNSNSKEVSKSDDGNKSIEQNKNSFHRYSNLSMMENEKCEDEYKKSRQRSLTRYNQQSVTSNGNLQPSSHSENAIIRPVSQTYILKQKPRNKIERNALNVFDDMKKRSTDNIKEQKQGKFKILSPKTLLFGQQRQSYVTHDQMKEFFKLPEKQQEMMKKNKNFMGQMFKSPSQHNQVGNKKIPNATAGFKAFKDQKSRHSQYDSQEKMMLNRPMSNKRIQHESDQENKGKTHHLVVNTQSSKHEKNCTMEKTFQSDIHQIEGNLQQIKQNDNQALDTPQRQQKNIASKWSSMEIQSQLLNSSNIQKQFNKFVEDNYQDFCEGNQTKRSRHSRKNSVESQKRIQRNEEQNSRPTEYEKKEEMLNIAKQIEVGKLQIFQQENNSSLVNIDTESKRSRQEYGQQANNAAAIIEKVQFNSASYRDSSKTHAFKENSNHIISVNVTPNDGSRQQYSYPISKKSNQDILEINEQNQKHESQKKLRDPDEINKLIELSGYQINMLADHSRVKSVENRNVNLNQQKSHEERWKNSQDIELSLDQKSHSSIVIKNESVAAKIILGASKTDQSINNTNLKVSDHQHSNSEEKYFVQSPQIQENKDSIVLQNQEINRSIRNDLPSMTQNGDDEQIEQRNNYNSIQSLNNTTINQLIENNKFINKEGNFDLQAIFLQVDPPQSRQEFDRNNFTPQNGQFCSQLPQMIHYSSGTNQFFSSNSYYAPNMDLNHHSQMSEAFAANQDGSSFVHTQPNDEPFQASRMIILQKDPKSKRKTRNSHQRASERISISNKSKVKTGQSINNTLISSNIEPLDKKFEFLQQINSSNLSKMQTLSNNQAKSKPYSIGRRILKGKGVFTYGKDEKEDFVDTLLDLYKNYGPGAQDGVTYLNYNRNNVIRRNEQYKGYLSSKRKKSSTPSRSNGTPKK